MTFMELVGCLVLTVIFIWLWKSFDAPRAPFICEVPGCGGMMEVVRPSSIVNSAIQSGVSRDQAVREVAGFYAATGVKLIYACRTCGRMKGVKF